MDSTMGQDILLEKIQSLNCTLLIWKNGKKKKRFLQNEYTISVEKLKNTEKHKEEYIKNPTFTTER